eukprot:3669091-Prymnesium_polylepis.1
MGCTAPLTRCHPPDCWLERSRLYPPFGSGPGLRSARRKVVTCTENRMYALDLLQRVGCSRVLPSRPVL